MYKFERVHSFEFIHFDSLITFVENKISSSMFSFPELKPGCTSLMIKFDVYISKVTSSQMKFADLATFFAQLNIVFINFNIKCINPDIIFANLQLGFPDL